jgi:hypothetical protein
MPHRILNLMMGGVAVFGVAAAAGAQAPQAKPPVDPKAVSTEIPRGLRPPSGMCRIWLDRVPAGQQPAPTDCASAIRNRPPNARVIFSEEPAGKAKAKPEPKPDDRKPDDRKADDRKPRKKPPE